MTEGKMVGWHHQLNAREFEQAPDDEGWGSLACCSSWGRKEWNTTERLNKGGKTNSTATLLGYMFNNEEK